jgi:hypothetical protein
MVIWFQPASRLLRGFAVLLFATDRSAIALLSMFLSPGPSG